MSTTKIQAFTEDETYNLLNFAGFGQVEADLWFVGFEPNLPENVNLGGFVELDQMMGRMDAVTNLGIDMDTFNTSILNGDGLLLSELILELIGKPYTEGDAVKFYLNQFLSDEGSAFFLPFFPVPLNQNIVDNFASIFPLFKSFEAYRQKGKKLRVEFIQELLTQFAPKTVLAILTDEQCHDFQEVFPQFKFENHNGILASWDTNTVIAIISPDQFSVENLPVLVNFISENSLPLDLEKEYGPARLSQAELDRLAKVEAKKVAAAKRKNKARHDPSDPFCVCEDCLKY